MKKNYKEIIEENESIKEVTKSFFSEETLKKGSNEEEPKPKRKYTRIKNRENKTHFITLRLSETDYNNLIEKIERSDKDTISAYVLDLIRKG